MSIYRKIYCIITAIMAIILLWFVISWVDVIAHNTMPYVIHHSWNFFDVLLSA